MRSAVSLDATDASGQRLLDRISTTSATAIDRLINQDTIGQVFDLLPPELKEHAGHLRDGVRRRAVGVSAEIWSARTETLRFIFGDAGFDAESIPRKPALARRQRRTSSL
ncbi:MAG: hypothetical protein FJ253_09745 [Phycisphaerae bacterium]|nr:hypothetical protein [Phycisphaerae bacterium]